MVDEALVQESDILVDAPVELPIVLRAGEMDFFEQLVEFPHGAMAGENVIEELDGVDAPHQGIGVRGAHGRIVMVFAHDGQVHGLGMGDTHPCVHVVQQVHVEEQMPGNGGNEPEGRFRVGGFIYAGLCEHVPHAIVDGFHGSGEGKGRHGPRHHLAHVPLGEQMPAQVFVPVKFFNVNHFRGDGTHLQEVQRAAAKGPFQVLFLAKAGPDFLAGLVEFPDFFFRE